MRKKTKCIKCIIWAWAAVAGVLYASTRASPEMKMAVEAIALAGIAGAYTLWQVIRPEGAVGGSANRWVAHLMATARTDEEAKSLLENVTKMAAALRQSYESGRATPEKGDTLTGVTSVATACYPTPPPATEAVSDAKVIATTKVSPEPGKDYCEICRSNPGVSRFDVTVEKGKDPLNLAICQDCLAMYRRDGLVLETETSAGSQETVVV
jgi:hypothetical protein